MCTTRARQLSNLLIRGRSHAYNFVYDLHVYHRPSWVKIEHEIVLLDRRSPIQSFQTVHTEHIVLQKSFPPMNAHPQLKGIERITSQAIKLESPQPERKNSKSMTSGRHISYPTSCMGSSAVLAKGRINAEAGSLDHGKLCYIFHD
jgi:hypothetical protein